MEYNRNKKIKNREILVDMLGGKCVRCGVTENLEFDHIDPETKKHKIAAILYLSINSAILIEEVLKCQLLCNDCHKIKTKEDSVRNNDGQVKLLVHGRASTYVNHKCRCDDCTRAWASYFKERRLKKA